MPDFIKTIRSKLAPGNTEGGEADVGPDGMAAILKTQPAREDYHVNVVNPPEKPIPAKVGK